VRFLIDENLSPKLVVALQSAIQVAPTSKPSASEAVSTPKSGRQRVKADSRF